IERIPAHTGNYERVVLRVIVGESSGKMRRSGWIELPSQPQIDRQLRGRRPLILQESEKLPLPVCRKVSTGIAASLAWQIKQEAGHVVIETCFRSGAVDLRRGLAVAEIENSARAERLILQQIVSHTPQVHTEFDRVIADDLRQRVSHQDIRFGPHPWQARRIAD